MKIGFDSKRLYCNFTGLGNYSRAIVKNLHAFYPDEAYHLYTPKLKPTPETNFFYDNPSFQTYVAKTAFKSYWRSFSIANQLQKDGIELYHGLSNEIPSSLKKTNIKSIVTIHDVIFRRHPELYPFIDRHIYDVKFRNSCINADKIIAISEHTKRDIIEFYGINPNKIEVIYQSCNPLFYDFTATETQDKILEKYGIPSEYLLCVGTVEKRKNVKLIIEAYQHLPPDFQLPLVIIGRGKGHKSELQELIKTHKLADKVIWLSNLEDNEHLQIIYQKAQILVYPSLYEGFGLPVAEALLSKTPAITSNVSSLPEAGGTAALYVNPYDAQELAQAIKKVLSDSALRKNMIDKGYQYAMKTFAPERVTRQLMECYNKLKS